MYRYNQARIKKENPSLLPGRGQTPRGRLSLTCGYCNTTPHLDMQLVLELQTNKLITLT